MFINISKNIQFELTIFHNVYLKFKYITVRFINLTRYQINKYK